MRIKLDAQFDDFDAFAFEKLFLQHGVRPANQNFSVRSNYAMPGYAFAGRSSSDRAASGSRAARQTQGFS